jgi:hypothetical protein
MPTDTRILRTLAEAIDVPYPQVLVRAGVLTPEELTAVQRPGPRRITPEQAADELGVVDPAERKAFVTLVNALTRNAPQEGERQQLAD